MSSHIRHRGSSRHITSDEELDAEVERPVRTALANDVGFQRCTTWLSF